MDYDIDSEKDILLLQSPPNAGTLRTVGALGQNFSATAAFEVVTVKVEGIPVNYAYALDGGVLYTIDLATGAATSVGAFDGAGKSYTGMVVRPLPLSSTLFRVTRTPGLRLWGFSFRGPEAMAERATRRQRGGVETAAVTRL